MALLHARRSKKKVLLIVDDVKHFAKKLIIRKERFVTIDMVETKNFPNVIDDEIRENEYVIYDPQQFATIERFDRIVKKLENFNYENLYFTEIQPWSIFAYIRFKWTNKFVRFCIPKRIFFSYPPYRDYIIVFDNPIYTFRYFLSIVFLYHVFWFILVYLGILDGRWDSIIRLVN